MTITHGDLPTAIDIMCEAAQWLIAIGQPMWRLQDITEQRILAGIDRDEVCVGWVAAESAAAMILQWDDPFFWPQAKDDSAFVHKLCVRRRFAGTGISGQMVEWAMQETKRRERPYLRLDCAGDRPALCSFYEKLGFRQVDRRMVGPYDTAFYELKLAPQRAIDFMPVHPKLTQVRFDHLESDFGFVCVLDLGTHEQAGRVLHFAPHCGPPLLPDLCSCLPLSLARTGIFRSIKGPSNKSLELTAGVPFGTVDMVLKDCGYMALVGAATQLYVSQPMSFSMIQLLSDAFGRTELPQSDEADVDSFMSILPCGVWDGLRNRADS